MVHLITFHNKNELKQLRQFYQNKSSVKPLHDNITLNSDAAVHSCSSKWVFKILQNFAMFTEIYVICSSISKGRN